MKSLYILPILLILACNSQRQMPEETSPGTPSSNELSIPTLPDFKASGNEPGWMLEIEYSKSIRFKSFGVDKFEWLLPVSEAKETTGDGETLYTSSSKEGSLSVRIMRKACMDAMSGKNFSYEVEVSAKPKGASQAQIFNGCGMYIGDYRLNDIWALKEFNGEKVNSKDFSRNAPYLEFNLRTQKMMGAGGCNQMSSSIDIADNTISFGVIMATKMACPQLKFESQFTAALSQKSMTYKLQGLLLLLEDEENRMVFQKVD